MAANVPTAPRLSNDAILEVFAHHSSSPQRSRLHRLGEHMLKLAYISALTEKRPNLRGDQLEHYIIINYPVFVAHWVNAYGWKSRMWAVPQGVDLDDPMEKRIIFETYAGAVVDGDPERILFGWIRELLSLSD